MHSPPKTNGRVLTKVNEDMVKVKDRTAKVEATQTALSYKRIKSPLLQLSKTTSVSVEICTNAG
jgi:hypothetical protein